MFLVADIGTTFLKATLADQLGNVAAQPVRIRLDNPSFPDCWLLAFKKACIELERLGTAIDCIMITGHGPTAVPVTCDGKAPLAVLWDSLGNRSGTPDFVERVRFLREKHPQVFEKTRLILGSAEYICWVLTGCACTSRPARGFEHFYQNDDRLRKNNLDPALFAPFMDSGKLLGTVRKTGFLKSGTPVLVPCPDYIPAIIGSGTVRPGMMCIRSGTGDGINLCTSERIEKPEFMTSAHPNGKDWNLGRIIPRTGIAVEKAIQEANLENENWEKALHHPHVLPVLERICRETVQAVDAIRDIGITEVRIAQGSMDSNLLNRMRSAYLGLPVSTLEYPETGLQGLAVLAAASVGNMDIAQTAQAVVRIRKTYNEKL